MKFRTLLLCLLCALGSLSALAKEVEIYYTELPDKTIQVSGIRNNMSVRVYIFIDGAQTFTINAESSAKVTANARQRVKYESSRGNGTLWTKPAQKEAPAETAAATPAQETLPATSYGEMDRKEKPAKDAREPRKAAADAEKPRTEAKAAEPAPEPAPEPGAPDLPDAATIKSLVDSYDFYNQNNIASFISRNNDYINSIEQAHNKAAIIEDYGISEYLDKVHREIGDEQKRLDKTAKEIAGHLSLTGATRDQALASITEILDSRLNQRNQSFLQLNNAVRDVTGEDRSADRGADAFWINILILAAIVAAAAIWGVKRWKKKRAAEVQSRPAETAPAAPATAREAIVVRRKTAVQMKKQSLDDVYDNPDYIKICSSEFAPDSAVDNIYIKNTCIKEVYNMYAEDLRNPNNPKEDGCMVLGRWVEDPVTNRYDVSLEYVVIPGDDAVFSEYELNFGGKIKLSVAEKLRKLRRDTNLQYDLTCWIHSHPGLGVFFSNSDCNVQTQLKHAQHPNFLIALVVDILTPEQETGIFTFKQDGTILSRPELGAMYSLEDLYRRAIDSERASASPDNYYDIRQNSPTVSPYCAKLMLNNNAIIDLSQIAVQAPEGLAGWAVGFEQETGRGRDFYVQEISRGPAKPAAGIIGCLVSMTHLSIPSIQRLVARETSNINFVIAYSPKTETITSIPVVNGQVVNDDRFHATASLEQLKIWTRRKR